MKDFKVGYASVNINPRLGCPVFGYYVPRFAKGFLDDLEACAVAFSLNGKTSLLISVDNGAIQKELIDKMTCGIEMSTNISSNDIIICATHTHTSPYCYESDMFEMDYRIVNEYADFLLQRVTDLAVLALADLKPAKLGFGTVTAPDRIAYIRRYKMKDGSTMTCPPINDSNIDHPIGKLDQRVHVIRIDRKNAESIVILNYGLHADCVNGELISSDWIGWVKRTLDKALDGVKCMCIIGAQGDVGSTNVNPVDGDMNDTEISFDNEMKSPGMARFIGRALAGAVLQIYDKVAYREVDTIKVVKKKLTVQANVPSEQELVTARRYKELHDAGRDDLIPYKAMELTTVVAEALRMCRMANGPKTFELPMSGMRIGNLAFIGIPGEPFTEIGVKIKETDGWGMICPSINTNGKEGYFPSKEAFDEGGYEARTSPFTAGVAQSIVDCAKEILKELKFKDRTK